MISDYNQWTWVANHAIPRARAQRVLQRSRLRLALQRPRPQRAARLSLRHRRHWLQPQLGRPQRPVPPLSHLPLWQSQQSQVRQHESQQHKQHVSKQLRQPQARLVLPLPVCSQIPGLPPALNPQNLLLGPSDTDSQSRSGFRDSDSSCCNGNPRLIPIVFVRLELEGALGYHTIWWLVGLIVDPQGWDCKHHWRPIRVVWRDADKHAKKSSKIQVTTRLILHVVT